MPPWLRQILRDVKAHRAYRELPAELRDRIEDGIQQPVEAAAAPPAPTASAPVPTAPAEPEQTGCPLCGGSGCARCKPPMATLAKPDVQKRRGPLPSPPPPATESPLAVLEREAPEDLAHGRRLLLTPNGLSAKSLMRATGNAFGCKPRVDRILDVFHTEIVKVRQGTYCFTHVDRRIDVPQDVPQTV